MIELNLEGRVDLDQVQIIIVEERAGARRNGKVSFVGQLWTLLLQLSFQNIQ